VRARPGEAPRGPVYTCLGPPDDLEPLMEYVDGAAPRPWRVTVEAPARPPDAWHRPAPHAWHWMLTRGPVPPRGPTHPVEEVDDADAVNALLDAANADSFARPGVPGIVTWLGVRQSARLIAVGALERMHDGTLHLRGVTVRTEARGAGVGSAVSAALTEHALAHGAGIATLGVYTDNGTALRIYGRLGYQVKHTFTSGEVAAP
jgi:GNAT superfamily N-acetyltransferase